MKKIKIAQIGTSRFSHGVSIWRSLRKQCDVFEVVGYALPEGEREKFPEWANDYDPALEMTVEEILSNPEIEAVAVETEEIYLTKYAQMVADAGKHLHMEKPGGTDINEFRRLIATLKEKGLAFSTGYMYRFNPKINEAIEKVKGGDIGEVYSVEAQMSCRHNAELREWISCFPGGMTFFLGCHLIDIIYRIQGEPDEIIPLSTSTGFDGAHGKDYGMVVMKYPKGVSYAKSSACEYGGFGRRHVVITGERGTIIINPLEWGANNGQQTMVHECHDPAWQPQYTHSTSDAFDRYDGMMYNFAELIRGKENPYTYDYELKLYELVQKCCGEEVNYEN